MNLAWNVTERERLTLYYDSAENHSTGLSAAFQLHSKPNSSPQRTIQSSQSKKANHPEFVIMLPAPFVDTFETRAECRANKLTLTRGRERTVLDKPGTVTTVELRRRSIHFMG